MWSDIKFDLKRVLNLCRWVLRVFSFLFYIFVYIIYKNGLLFWRYAFFSSAAMLGVSLSVYWNWVGFFLVHSVYKWLYVFSFGWLPCSTVHFMRFGRKTFFKLLTSVMFVRFGETKRYLIYWTKLNSFISFPMREIGFY